MPVNRPYRRTCRQCSDGNYSEGGRSRYIVHPLFADSPTQYIRAFLLIQNDMIKLFEYIEPSDTNLNCYSYRVHEILVRTCIEVEANLKAILVENGYKKKCRKGCDRACGGKCNMDMYDYRKVELSHRLSSYELKFPTWHGNDSRRQPFREWAHNQRLPWYETYNATKHSRHDAFQQATFKHMTDAVAGLAAILAAQFYTYEFSPRDNLLSVEFGEHVDQTEDMAGAYFRVRFPVDWPLEHRYDFDWQELKDCPEPFRDFPYQQ